MLNVYAQNASGYMYNAVYGYLIFSGVAFIAIFIVAFRVNGLNLYESSSEIGTVSGFPGWDPGNHPFPANDPCEEEDLGSETLP